jgi:hypothetical protein
MVSAWFAPGLSSPRPATRDPILTMLSIGVEKLYKLTLGLIALDVDKQWPSAKVMKANGHKLGDMHQKVIEELRERTRSKSQYVRGLLAEVESDPVVIPVIEALDMYGRRVVSTISTSSASRPSR